MIRKPVYIVVLVLILNLLFCPSVFSVEQTKPEKEYRNVLLLKNKEVYGVTHQKSKAGRYIPVKLTGEEKIKVLLYKFTMKDDISIDMLKTDETQKLITDILKTENKSAVKLLREWLKDKNPHNRNKAAYLLEIMRKPSH